MYIIIVIYFNLPDTLLHYLGVYMDHYLSEMLRTLIQGYTSALQLIYMDQILSLLT